MTKVLEFSEIDDLFFKYKEASNQENTEEYLDRLKNDIICALWNNLKTKKWIAGVLSENADAMVKTTTYCIKKYVEYENHQGFSAYTTKSIKNKLMNNSIETSFLDSTGGMHISDNYKKTQKKLKRIYQSFIVLRKDRVSEQELNNDFVEYASKYFDVDKNIVVDFLNPQCTISKVKRNSEEISNIIDFVCDSNAYSPQQLYELNEINNELLSKINEQWNKQKEDTKQLMSELLTLIVIEALNKKYINIEYTIFENFKFINRKMLKIYFFNHDEEIPSHQEIGEKYGLTKSGVSKKISRFFEKII